VASGARGSVGRRNGVGAPFPNPAAKQAELFEERRSADGGLGLALIRDGNGPRSFETRWSEPAPTSVVDAL
jgi:hypothetical protein